MADLFFSPVAYAERLLAWYGRCGRDLPWRNTRDPYRIWLSEIMLQQTTVAAVVEYYRRFLARLPTVERLAAAPLEQVIDLWAGLGYYSRARNLHAAARLVVEQYAGVFPDDAAVLQTLPGIGRSTAGAIAALAFDKRAPILDGNVRRVLCRLFALQEPPRSTSAEKQLWQWSELLTPHEQVHDYTQAVMDLGATVCVPRNPLCRQCPLMDLCRAFALGLEQQLPVKQPAKRIPTRQEVVLLLDHDGRYLVRRRAAEGFLGGLWEFPAVSLAADADSEEQLRHLIADFGVRGAIEPLGRIQHVYSHFRLQAEIYHLRIAALPSVAEGESCWFPLPELETLALHGAHKKVLDKLLHNGD